MATSTYRLDIVAWANEQARLLRAGLFSQLDIEHIAEEIEDVGKSERRELRNRMAVLLAHLLKWQYQTGYRGNSWRRTIILQRRSLVKCLKETPSLKVELDSPEWWAWAWDDGVSLAVRETGLDCFPDMCPWTVAQILDSEWLPGGAE